VPLSSSNPAVAYIIGDSTARAFGLSGRDRLIKQLSKLGIPVSGTSEEATVLFSGTHAYGASALSALASAEQGTVMLDDAGHPVAMRVAPDDALTALDHLAQGQMPPNEQGQSGLELAGSYDHILRKRADPLVMDMNETDAVERALFKASYKGVTDLVTKYAWPVPALAATRWCALKGLTPNQITSVGAVLVLVSFWCFWSGYFLVGLLLGWIMTFLDTVDGKLARVTMTSSPFGNIYDHGIDLIHPPFWWWAWIVGCAAIGLPLDDGGLVLAIILVGYVLQRIEEAIFVRSFGMHIHVWQRFDSWFRLITARRNPNMVILTIFVLFGAPREGIVAVAVWVAICLLIHLVRLVQGFIANKERKLESWLAEI